MPYKVVGHGEGRAHAICNEEDTRDRGEMTERIHTEHGDLSLEEIADSLPSTGDVMYLVGQCWWKCAHAARAGGWDLSAYFARRVRGLQRKLAVIRPKYGADLARFEDERIGPVLAALERHDLPGFETAFAAATDDANQLHAKWGKGYLRWVLPAEPPTDLDLGPGAPGPMDSSIRRT